MNSIVEFEPHAIITKSRSFLDFLTLGNWRRTCTLDFSTGILEEKTKWLTAITVERYNLGTFDAVDYSYELMASGSHNGVEHELDEFRVGLRFAATGKILPLAVFRGHIATPYGLTALIESFFPASWRNQDIRHELEARSLANLLCDKLNVELA